MRPIETQVDYLTDAQLQAATSMITFPGPGADRRTLFQRDESYGLVDDLGWLDSDWSDGLNVERNPRIVSK